jgi:hypothetical protein
MPITVVLQDIYGKRIKEFVPTGGLLDRLLPMADPRFPMLRYVDPDGNTIFNPGQMYTVLEELDRLAAEVSSNEAVQILASLREFAIYCRDHPHIYLRFIGD